MEPNRKLSDESGLLYMALLRATTEEERNELLFNASSAAVLKEALLRFSRAFGD